MSFSSIVRAGIVLPMVFLAACAPARVVRTFDVEETGTLMRNTPGLTPGVWYISYEETGEPAFTKRLSFAENAECIVRGQRSACPRSIFEQDLLVTVRGTDENGGILVEEMEIVGATSSAPETNDSLPRHHEGSGFTIDFPAGWTVTEDDTVVTQSYELSGTSIAAPSEHDTTTLTEAKVHIALNQTCPAQNENESDTVIINGRMWLETEWSGVGAGNLYEGATYTLPTGNRCAVITFYTHSCNLGLKECGPNVEKKYDKTALFATFREILDTLEVK